jgi:hypothetical protein
MKMINVILPETDFKCRKELKMLLKPHRKKLKSFKRELRF